MLTKQELIIIAAAFKDQRVAEADVYKALLKTQTQLRDDQVARQLFAVMDLVYRVR